jgi:hypothetical protein
VRASASLDEDGDALRPSDFDHRRVALVYAIISSQGQPQNGSLPVLYLPPVIIKHCTIKLQEKESRLLPKKLEDQKL